MKNLVSFCNTVHFSQVLVQLFPSLKRRIQGIQGKAMFSLEQFPGCGQDICAVEPVIDWYFDAGCELSFHPIDNEVDRNSGKIYMQTSPKGQVGVAVQVFYVGAHSGAKPADISDDAISGNGVRIYSSYVLFSPFNDLRGLDQRTNLLKIPVFGFCKFLIFMLAKREQRLVPHGSDGVVGRDDRANAYNRGSPSRKSSDPARVTLVKAFTLAKRRAERASVVEQNQKHKKRKSADEANDQPNCELFHISAISTAGLSCGVSS